MRGTRRPRLRPRGCQGRPESDARPRRERDHPSGCTQGQSLTPYPRGMSSHRPLSAVILAAGRGTRMNSRMAKVLHPLCGRTMLGWALHAIAPLHPDRVAVVVGHQSDDVAKAIVNEAPEGLAVLKPIGQEKQLGTGHALMTALSELPALPDEDLLVLAADHPLLESEMLTGLLFAHRESGAPWTMATVQLDDPSGYGRVVYSEDGSVDCVIEEADCGPEESAITEVSPLIYCMRRAEVEPVLEDLDDDNAQSEVYLNGAIDLIEGVSAVRLDADAAKQVNDRVQLAECEAILRQRINENLLRNGVTMIDPLRVYVDVGVYVGPDCLLYPGVHLEGVTS